MPTRAAQPKKDLQLYVPSGEESLSSALNPGLDEARLQEYVEKTALWQIIPQFSADQRGDWNQPAPSAADAIAHGV